MTKAYSYIRFSTPEQLKGDSKRRQTQQAEEYAAANGLELDNQLTYSDYGVSAFRGANVEIGKLGQFMEAIRRKEVENGSFLLVESLDRISRDLILPAQNIFTQIILEGVTIVTLADRRVYSADLVNKAPFLLIEAIVILIRANEESETKSKRIKASWENRRKNITTNPITALGPAWLKFNKKSRKFEIIEERANIIRRMYQEHLNGRGCGSIARGLREDKIPTWTFKKGEKSIWREHYVWRILNSTSIIGRLTPHIMDGKKRIPLPEIKGYYPSVITEELFYHVQSVRHKFKKLYRGPVTVRNIFSMLGRCPQCGSRFFYDSKGKGYSYLTCSSFKYNQGCDNKPISYFPLESAFILEFEKALATFPPANNALGKLHFELTEVRNRIKEAEIERIRLISRVFAGCGVANNKDSLVADANCEHLDCAIDGFQKELKSLSFQTEQAKQQQIDDLTREFNIANAIIPRDLEQINRVLRNICSSILIHSGKIEIAFKLGPKLLIEYGKGFSGFKYVDTNLQMPSCG